MRFGTSESRRVAVFSMLVGLGAIAVGLTSAYAAGGECFANSAWTNTNSGRIFFDIVAGF